MNKKTMYSVFGGIMVVLSAGIWVFSSSIVSMSTPSPSRGERVVSNVQKPRGTVARLLDEEKPLLELSDSIFEEFNSHLKGFQEAYGLPSGFSEEYRYVSGMVYLTEGSDDISYLLDTRGFVQGVVFKDESQIKTYAKSLKGFNPFVDEGTGHTVYLTNESVLVEVDGTPYLSMELKYNNRKEDLSIGKELYQDTTFGLSKGDLTDSEYLGYLIMPETATLDSVRAYPAYRKGDTTYLLGTGGIVAGVIVSDYSSDISKYVASRGSDWVVARVDGGYLCLSKVF